MTINSWQYQINGSLHKTIESQNTSGQRVWVKFVPVQQGQPVRVTNILDIPSNVNWRIKTSHFETIDPNGARHSYTGVGQAGSLNLPAGTTNLQKDTGAETVFFLIEPAGAQPPTSLDVGSDSTGSVTLTLDQPAWVGYATSQGDIQQLPPDNPPPS